MFPEYQAILCQIYGEVLAAAPEGKVADYIPSFPKMSADKFGMHLTIAEGLDFSVGNSEEKFSIQSITRVFLFAMTASSQGRELWKKVGVEASGDPFNSLVQLEHEEGIPEILLSISEHSPFVTCFSANTMTPSRASSTSSAEFPTIPPSATMNL